MNIDGINISTFGLKVETMEGDSSLPARKKILKEQGFAAKDIVFQERGIRVVLFGDYADLATLRTNVEAFKTLIKTSLVHDFIRSSHGLIFSGVIVNGVKVSVENRTAVLNFTINAIE